MSEDKPLTIAIIVGEVSGDILGAGLMKALLEHYPNANFMGIGGPRMLELGFDSWYSMERLAVMGIGEVLGRLPELLKLRKELIAGLIARKPDLLIGIDAPDFNLTVEEKLREVGCKTVHYVSPSVWAWRQGRINKIKRAVNHMLTLLPFEAAFYKAHHQPVSFVGHPLADDIPLQADKQSARETLGLAMDDSVLAVLPGSRGGEVKYIGPPFFESIAWLLNRKPELKIVIPAVNEARREQIQQLVDRYQIGNQLHIVDGQSRTCMAAADAVLLASGTATLEAMLLKKPMVVAYKWSWLSHLIIAPQMKAKFISLPNLLADEMVVPEFVQQKAKLETIAPAILTALESDNSELEKRFTRLHEQLKQDASAKAALAIKSVIEND